MEDKERSSKVKTARNKVHPRERAGILSVLCFCWVFPLFKKGLKKDLSEEDLYGPLRAHKSEILGDKLEEAWLKEVRTRKNPSLWRAILKIFGKETAVFGFMVVVQELVIKMAQPLLIGKFLSYFTPDQVEISKKEAYVYGILLCITTLVTVFLVHSYMLGLQHLGMKMRVACCSLIYRKSLRLSREAMVDTTVGQMVNLLSNDAKRFDSVTMHFHHLWLAPIETAIIVYLLYTTVDPTAMVGISVLLVFAPLQVYIAKKIAGFRLKIALKTDNRVRLMNEIISGIQVIKTYTWEKPFAKLVEKSRQLEIKEIRGASYLRAINASFMLFLNRSAVFISILVYVLLGNHLRAEYVFVITPFYGMLRQVITMWLPQGLTNLVETNVSVKRIQKFLLHDEINTEELNGFQNGKTQINGINGSMKNHLRYEKTGIFMKGVSAKWTKENQNDTLHKVDFTVGPQELVALVGPVGSGKSTLLQVILKELPILEGVLEVGGTISYASQEPWLFSGSIRQNILFGLEMDMKRYQKVVQVCSLERDFSLFPYNDRTIIGERGVMLSGGQKARISLARAVYKDTDIYLLDDPLSAVDAHVGKDLYENCIKGFLRDKCTLLVTHQLQYLATVDKIYLLENGSIEASGTYDQLKSVDSDFVKLLHNATDDNQDQNEQDDELKKAKSLKSLENLALPVEIKEQRTSGNVSRSVYKQYMKAGGSYWLFALILSFFVLAQITASGTDYFLTFWVNTEEKRYQSEMTSNENKSMNATDLNSTESEETFWEKFLVTENSLYIYTALIVFILVISLTRTLSFFTICMRASIKLHNTMFSKIVYTPMRFFNTNSSGRILNRFSKDMGAIDENLPSVVIDTLQVGLTVLSITVLICSVNPWILIPTVVISGAFYGYRCVFLATSTDLKRMDGTARSPVFSHLTASIQGLTTIRAFKAEDILIKEFDNHQDLHSSAHYMFIGANRTFGFWLDMNCVIFITFVILSFLFIGTETHGGNVGLTITQSITLTGMLQWGMRQWSDLENQMTSVERVIEYTEITPESDEGKKMPPKDWPSEGNIVFQQVSMRYSPDNPHVLKNLTFRIDQEEKIGVVGRTGAGKSSLISALFRLVEIEGKIIIDGVVTSDISLHGLRSKISLIPQEPVLFSGTLRNNLDPFDEYSDEQLWGALEEVELKNVIAELPSGLQSSVTEGGSNFSVGQRQLLCLARAVIRSNRILILDEATANVDPQTDELIQTTIRKKFQHCTVLTIAHRLHTVMDSDKILVMDGGNAVEFDHPHVLLQNSEGVLSRLVRQTGKGMTENLTEIAKNSFPEKRDNF